MPAANIRSFEPRRAFSTSSPYDSTKAPIGIISVKRPVDLTRIFSTREIMPCPASWITIAKTRANHTANVDGT